MDHGQRDSQPAAERAASPEASPITPALPQDSVPPQPASSTPETAPPQDALAKDILLSMLCSWALLLLSNSATGLPY